MRPTVITCESQLLFHRHKSRFTHGVPDSIYDFLSDNPSRVPNEGAQLSVYENETLIAESYFDLGARSVSGIYATFEPQCAHRRLGIFTLLKEIEFSIEAGKEFYYLGYSYSGFSFYDYKKRFRSSESFDWKRGWETFKKID
jgi:arginine-tRNA-protein transferase